MKLSHTEKFENGQLRGSISSQLLDISPNSFGI
jgi:hypothetical protein